MSADDDGLDPPRDGFGDSGEDNGFTEDCTTKDIPDLSSRKNVLAPFTILGKGNNKY